MCSPQPAGLKQLAYFCKLHPECAGVFHRGKASKNTKVPLQHKGLFVVRVTWSCLLALHSLMLSQSESPAAAYTGSRRDAFVVVRQTWKHKYVKSTLCPLPAGESFVRDGMSSRHTTTFFTHFFQSNTPVTESHAELITNRAKQETDLRPPAKPFGSLKCPAFTGTYMFNCRRNLL